MPQLDPVSSTQASFNPFANATGGGRAAAVSSSGKLTDQQQAEVRQLKQTDSHVRAHEQAHMAAGGIYVRGGASFGYATGPDGNQYATSGEVSIDTSPGKTPQETVEKARVIQKAALAPSDPSAQDRAVAASAAAMERQAAGQVAEERRNQQDASNQAGSLSVKPVLPRVGLNIDVTA
jgi:hypothetical protein